MQLSYLVLKELNKKKVKSWSSVFCNKVTLNMTKNVKYPWGRHIKIMCLYCVKCSFVTLKAACAYSKLCVSFNNYFYIVLPTLQFLHSVTGYTCMFRQTEWYEWDWELHCSLVLAGAEPTCKVLFIDIHSLSFVCQVFLFFLCTVIKISRNAFMQ